MGSPQGNPGEVDIPGALAERGDVLLQRRGPLIALHSAAWLTCCGMCQ